MREINRLTNDEDLRQELWLFFLEGNHPYLFHEYLLTLQSKQNKINMELIYGT